MESIAIFLFCQTLRTIDGITENTKTNSIADMLIVCEGDDLITKPRFQTII